MRPLTFIAIILACLVIFAQKAKATEWLHVSTSSENSKLYFEMSTVRSVENEVIELWYKIEYAKIKSVQGLNYKYIVAKSYFDCSNISVGLLRVIYYTSKNKSVYDLRITSEQFEVEQLAPGTFFYDPIVTLCLASKIKEF